jgi:hypothetical protein
VGRGITGSPKRKGGRTVEKNMHETGVFANLRFLLFLAGGLTIHNVISTEGNLLMLP